MNIKRMTGIKKILLKQKLTLAYGSSLALLLFLLKWLELRFIIINHSLEIYMGAIALIFTGVGIWLALKLSKPTIKTILVEKEVYIYSNENGHGLHADFRLNESLIADLALSNRELEILGLMSEGNSNQEIADRIFISLSTVKTHNQHLFEKLAVKRRTQAIEKAKRLSLIP